jgi:hypothetical protein
MILLLQPHADNDCNFIIYLCTNKNSKEFLDELDLNLYISNDDGIMAKPDDPFLLSYIYAN